MFDPKEILGLSLECVEKNLQEHLTLDDVARYAGVSKFHLHRLFRSVTGESLMDYVQSRKLTSSLRELSGSQMRVIDIALQYGFDYEQSYIRAFKRRFGYTPLKVRSEGMSLRTQERISLSDMTGMGNSVSYKPFFMFRQRFHLCGIPHTLHTRQGANQANIFGREFYYSAREAITNPVSPEVYWGYARWAGRSEPTEYMPAIEVSDTRAIPEGMTGLTIPAHRYVVFRLSGYFRPEEIQGRQIGRILVHLHRRWIQHTDFRIADKFRLECIHMDQASDNYCELDILQPITDRHPQPVPEMG